MEKEIYHRPLSGYVGLLLTLALLGSGAGVLFIANEAVFPSILGGLLLVCGFITFGGYLVINPNEASVLILFGDYVGTANENGFYWVNPFFVKKKISLRARNRDSEPIKVNDKLGNPIMIGIVLVWRVQNTFKASFEVDDYVRFVEIQSESAIRKLAGHYAYDNFDEEQKEITLRSGGEEVHVQLETELSERLLIAGIEVIEARITYLAYAQEIAGAMLRRQQATAIVAARFKIVEGAVSMVEMALDQLSKKHIIDLDDERKAAMVSNMMVVLCSDKDASPVINTGTLQQ
ncbi:MAG: SPFH domain-containing protein [Bacteroidetes bacterium]|nr:SPFH domain-containing protein [Bacteroidota bacterium]